MLQPLTGKELSNTIVYIDEINTVLTYLLTCGNLKSQFLVYKLLRIILINCYTIIMTDADVSDLVF